MSELIEFNGGLYLSFGDQERTIIAFACPYCGGTNRHDLSDLIPDPGEFKCRHCNGGYRYRDCTVQIILPKGE